MEVTGITPPTKARATEATLREQEESEKLLNSELEKLHSLSPEDLREIDPRLINLLQSAFFGGFELGIQLQFPDGNAAKARRTLVDMLSAFKGVPHENVGSNIVYPDRILRPRESFVLIRRFGLSGDIPELLDQVGQKLGITGERVRTVEARAIRRLRNPANSRRLTPLFTTTGK